MKKSNSNWSERVTTSLSCNILWRGDPDSAPLKLLCFYAAGGNAAAFAAGWTRSLLPEVALGIVELPGRGTRAGDPLVRRLPELLPELEETFAALDPKSFAVFGHSLGALIGFELLRTLAAKGIVPSLFCIASCAAPNRRKVWDPPLHSLGDAALAQAVQQFGASTALSRRPDLLSVLRADLEVYETCTVEPAKSLPIALHAIHGRHDPVVSAADMAAWDRYTSASCVHESLPGDHMFTGHMPELAARVSQLALESVPPSRLVPPDVRRRIESLTPTRRELFRRRVRERLARPT